MDFAEVALINSINFVTIREKTVFWVMMVCSLVSA